MSTQGTKSSNEGNPLSLLAQLVGYAPGVWPKGWTGTKTLPFSGAALGALTGYLGGQLGGSVLDAEDDTRRRIARRLMTMGALIGGAGGTGAMLMAANSPRSATDSRPLSVSELYKTTGQYKEHPYNISTKAKTKKSEPTTLTSAPAEKQTPSRKQVKGAAAPVMSCVGGQCFSGSLGTASVLPFSDPIPTGSSLRFIADDPTMSPSQKAMTSLVIWDANDGGSKGFITPTQVIRSAIDVGLGMSAGKLLSGILGLPTSTKTNLTRLGGLGGLLMSFDIL